MNRKLKIIGLAVTAVFAMSALAASAAQAYEFTSSNTAKFHAHEHTFISGTQSTTHSFTAGAGFGSITCSTAKFTGTSATGTDPDIRITPHYTGCVDSFGRTVDVIPNGCEYTFTVATQSPSNFDTYEGTVHIICPAEKVIEVKITSGGSTICTVKIGAQNNVGPIHYELMTSKSPTDVTVESRAENVKNTTEGGFFNCGISNGEHQGTYTGNTTVTGENTFGEPMDLTIK